MTDSRHAPTVCAVLVSGVDIMDIVRTTGHGYPRSPFDKLRVSGSWCGKLTTSGQAAFLRRHPTPTVPSAGGVSSGV